MILERFRLDGKVALVTGGTRGIGLAIAHALGEAGARLIISSKTERPESMEGLKRAGYQADYIPADMMEIDAPQRLIDEAQRLAGRVDILVNNAGVARHGNSEEFAEQHYRDIMGTNLDSVFRCCRSVLPVMQKQGGGVICNIGSISGLVSNIPQRQSAYNASKAAVHMLTRSLASEFAEQNIRVNAIAPGYIETDMTAGGFAREDWASVWKFMTPMGRWGQPEEIATAALFLCSPASSYMTGEVMVIDGGYTTR